jgi:hypothetical protein
MVRLIFSFLIGAMLFLSCTADGFAAFKLGENGPRINGFLENDFGLKLGNDQTKRDDFNFFEQRLQLKARMYPEWNSLLEEWMAQVEAKADFTVDEYYNGRTGAELRVLSLGLVPTDSLDVKIGRQVFTWGTGDYLFVNDLFPKDYVSFYIGREDEYLKKPNDGIKTSIYSDMINTDIIITPVFEPNTLFTGQRISFFDPFQSGIAGTNSDRKLIGPAKTPENAQYALRFFRNFQSYETALYFFRGNYPSPRGYLSELNRELFYPRLDVYGASIRGQALAGIANLEIGYYNSRQDEKGDNRLIENPMFKLLIGYSQDLGNDLSIGLQYLFEQTLKYDNYRAALMPQDFVWDEYRHLNTLRLTKLYRLQTVRANLFIFFSSSDLDGYARPSVSYDISDAWQVTLGANLPWGEDTHTEFGQTEHNKNIYTRIRYSF